METIKFRAWDNSWKKKVMIYFGIFDTDEGLYCKDGVTDIRKAEIMQFTGLLDSKGKEIYCGDIVKMSEFAKENPNENLVIEYSFGVPTAHPVGNRFFCVYSIHDLCVDSLGNHKPKNGVAGEVIGNIYQNKELLR